MTQRPRVFTARSYGDLASWCWNPGLGSLVWCWDLSLWRYPSILYPAHVVFGTSEFHISMSPRCPSYQSGWMWFNSLVVRLPYSSIFCWFWVMFVLYFRYNFAVVVQGGELCVPTSPSWPEVWIWIFNRNTNLQVLLKFRILGWNSKWKEKLFKIDRPLTDRKKVMLDVKISFSIEILWMKENLQMKEKTGENYELKINILKWAWYRYNPLFPNHMLDIGKTALTDYETSKTEYLRKQLIYLCPPCVCMYVYIFTCIRVCVCAVFHEGKVFIYYHIPRAWTMPDAWRVLNIGWMNKYISAGNIILHSFLFST